ncbi:hypothetical protein ACSQ67_010853 [Phaseolus vulgaris]
MFCSVLIWSKNCSFSPLTHPLPFLYFTSTLLLLIAYNRHIPVPDTNTHSTNIHRLVNMFAGSCWVNCHCNTLSKTRSPPTSL